MFLAPSVQLEQGFGAMDGLLGCFNKAIVFDPELSTTARDSDTKTWGEAV